MFIANPNLIALALSWINLKALRPPHCLLTISPYYILRDHITIKDKLIGLIEHTFSRGKALYLACNDQRAFFTSDVYKNDSLWSYKKVCEAVFIFWIIFLSDLELNFTDKL